MVGKALGRMIPGEVTYMDNRIGNVGETLSEKPDRVVLGVLDEKRQMEMMEQLGQLQFEGETIAYPRLFDARIAVMRLLAPQIPDGAIAELGVYKGDFACELATAFPDREMHLYDSFEGFDGQFTDTSAEAVAERLPEARIHQGYFPDTFEEHKYAFLSLDADLYEPTKEGLRLFWKCMVDNGVVMVHDYYSSQFPGVKKAVDEFCSEMNILPFPVCDVHGTVVLRK